MFERVTRSLAACLLAVLVAASAAVAQTPTPYNAITTVAGGPSQVSGAALSFPTGVAVDAAGNLYVADTGRCVVLEISDGKTTVLAGTPGNCTYDSSANPTTFAYPVDVAVCAGNIYFITHGVDPSLPSQSGLPMVGGSLYVVTGDLISSLPMPSPQARAITPLYPVALACDSTGNAYLSSYYLTTGGGFEGAVDEIPEDGQPAQNLDTQFDQAFPGITVDSKGNVYVIAQGAAEGWLGVSSGEEGGGNLLLLTGNSGSTLLNLGSPVQNPGRLTLDASHNYYYTQAASGDTPQVYVTESPLGYAVQDTIAGNGAAGFAGDDGPPLKAELNGAAGLAIDACGSIYVADALNGRIRKILNTNTASTAQCTSGSSGSSSSGGSGSSGSGVATSISLTAAPGQQVTAPGTITFNSTVNLINCPACTGPLTGEVFFCYVAAPSTNGCGIGSTPLGAVLLDGPSATEAAASLTTSFAIPGTYYVAAEYADATGTYPSSTAVTLQITVCGTACIDPGVPNIPVSPYPVAFTPGQVVIGFVSPGVVAFDAAGNTYFLNSGAGTVTRLDTQGGSTQIVPGSLATGLSDPSDMVIGSDGSLYITDTGNNRIIQVVSPAGASPTVNVITPSLSPGLNSPTGIFETSSEVYVSDTGNQRVVAFRTNGTFPSVLFSAQTNGVPPIGSLEGIVVNPTTLEIYVANTPLGGVPLVGNILEATIGGTPSVLPMPAGVTLRSPYGLALDAANGLYFSDT
ncbi:MAG TPA: NHL repeat-containing protein, partial [Candidatus Acidoferrum sp.]|nr:NHL repeat-containing protein [Candidatus Acidoferrum sp.]